MMMMKRMKRMKRNSTMMNDATVLKNDPRC
jgi:hypothetical protein